MNGPETPSEYLKKIGKRGGLKRSKVKTEAARKNLEIARLELAKKRAKKAALTQQNRDKLDL